MMESEKSIEQLCRATWEDIYKYVYFKVQNKEEAEDITQETYIKAISYIQKNDIKINKFVSFLKTVSSNVIKDRWRKDKRYGTIVNIDDINPKEASIEDHTQTMAQRELIETALKLLNEEQRRVIELRILKGDSVAHTAKVMDKSEGNVRVLQYRALQNLTKILKGDI
jgi:RNA polymerase sigma-70 factor (ECF subfamily)